MQTTEYRYGCVYRPASLGAIPSYPHRVEDSLPEERARKYYTRHGIVVFDQPLTDQELIAFELAVLADDKLTSEIAAHVAQSMRQYARAYVEQAAKDPEQFQHTVIDRMRDARRYLVYIENLPKFVELVMELLQEFAKIEVLNN